MDRFRNAGPNESKARVTNRWGPRISHHGQFLAGSHARHKFRKASLLIVLVEADQWLADLKVGEKLGGPPCVLGNHHIAATQCIHGPQGQIPQISDRRGNKG